MNSRTFVISDTHFYHKNIVKFAARPFPDVTTMNRVMVERWNSVVRDEDIVWHLGDVAMWKAREYEIVKQLKGRKRLLLGNHDTLPPHIYTMVGFERVQSCHELNGGVILTHVPVHTSQMNRWRLNIHGHTHTELVGQRVEYFNQGEDPRVVFMPDERYVNVCVEYTDYTPKRLVDVLALASVRNNQ